MKIKRIILPIFTLGVMGFVLASCGSETDKNNDSKVNTGDNIESHTHTYGDWTTTKEATESEKGSREKTCTVCGDKVKEEIAKLDHDYEITYTWTADASTCTARAVCKRNSSHVLEETVNSTTEAITEPTFLKAGTGKTVANFTNSAFTKQSLNAIFEIPMKDFERVENKVYFGTYPQTKVEATAENGLSSILFDNTWTSYRYYLYGEVADYMYYKDIDIDDNGTYDYRGVRFSDFRANNCLSVSYDIATRQSLYGYNTYVTYWFKYEPIEWNILSEENGKALIVANPILDAQEFNPSDNGSAFLHNGKTGYDNNYELSSIRLWLNNNFYNTAFNTTQKAKIEETEVKNDAYSTGYTTNSYACDDTNDNIFLLSVQELAIYSSEINPIIKATGTDYALCQNLFVNTDSGSSKTSSWLLRSPGSSSKTSPKSVVLVKEDGTKGNNDTKWTYNGVRPACWIEL